MSGGRAERIETAVDACAAALLGAAAAIAAAKSGASHLVAAAVAAIACLAAFVALRRVAPEATTFPLGNFDSAAVELDEAAELVLTDADRLVPEELVLDDVLAELGPESRVVRLFDPTAMPTPGQLKARIDRHLAGPDRDADASDALHEALAELRRSLR